MRYPSQQKELIYKTLGTSVISCQIYSPFLANVKTLPQPPSVKHFISEMKLPTTDTQLLTTQSSMTPIVIDSGATFGTTPFESDIIPGTLEPVDLEVKNLSGSSDIVARGFGRWVVEDIHGNRSILEPYLHVVPRSEVRLFSPQEYFRSIDGGTYHITHKTSYLNLPNN